MFVSKAEYRVSATFAERNLENIRAFLPLVPERLRPGSSYSVSASDDGRTFLHVFNHEGESDTEVLAEIPAFLHFLNEVFPACEAPPSMATFREI